MRIVSNIAEYREFLNDNKEIANKKLMFAQNGYYLFRSKYDRTMYEMLTEDLIKVIRKYQDMDVTFEQLGDIRSEWNSETRPLFRELERIKYERRDD